MDPVPIIAKNKAENMIETEGTCALGEALKDNSTLKTLNLESVQLQQSKSKHEHSTDRNDQAENDILNKGTYSPIEALKVNTTLTSLALGGKKHQKQCRKLKTRNHKTSTGRIEPGEQTCALREVLKVNTTLTTLRLRSETPHECQAQVWLQQQQNSDFHRR